MGYTKSSDSGGSRSRESGAATPSNKVTAPITNKGNVGSGPSANNTKTGQTPERARPITERKSISADTNEEKFFIYATQDDEQRYIHTYEDASDAYYWMEWIWEIPIIEERLQICEAFHGIFCPSEIERREIE